MTNSTVRSMQDDPTSDPWGGQNVFDVFTKAQGTGLGGTEYKEW
jgi:general secretion pathway protein G